MIVTNIYYYIYIDKANIDIFTVISDGGVFLEKVIVGTVIHKSGWLRLIRCLHLVRLNLHHHLCCKKQLMRVFGL